MAKPHLYREAPCPRCGQGWSAPAPSPRRWSANGQAASVPGGALPALWPELVCARAGTLGCRGRTTHEATACLRARVATASAPVRHCRARLRVGGDSVRACACRRGRSSSENIIGVTKFFTQTTSTNWNDSFHTFQFTSTASDPFLFFL
jgi:hypothetical protein